MTPKKEKTKQVKIRVNGKSRFIEGMGEKSSATASIAAELSSPRSTPIRDLPTIIEKALTGDIRVSSKHL